MSDVVSYADISSCHDSTEGEDLLHENGVKTEGLNPPETWIPWVTINGVS